MNAASAKRVLLVGNCGKDQGQLTALLRVHFAVEIAAADDNEAALDLLRAQPYDLVLVNRIFHGNGQSGLDFIRRLKAEAPLAATPVMLLSNYAVYQQEAMAAGAAAGFGKGELADPQTTARLRPFLG